MSTRLLIVTLILFLIGLITLALGIFLLAVADLVGAILFFTLWVRRR